MTTTLTHAPARAPGPLARIPAFALVASVPLWIIGWSVMRIDGHKGPGWGWTTAHVLWVGVFALFAVVAVTLYRLTGRTGAWPKASLGVALAGAVAMLGQMGLDLYVGFAAADKDAMGDRYDEVFAVPGVDLVFFQVGPILLFVGLLLLMIVAAKRGAVSTAAPIVLFLGISLMAGGRFFEMPLRVIEAVGAVLMWMVLAPLARSLPKSGRE